MLTRLSKENQIQKLKENFSKSKASFLVNCMGLNVEQMTDFRKKLKQNKGNIQIIRNTLSLKAMEKEENLKEAYTSFMKGPNAFVIAYGEPAKIAQLIHEMKEENEFFQIKGGVLEGEILTKEDIGILAKLPSEEVLKSQLLGLLSAPLMKFLLTVKEVPQSFVRLLSAKKENLEKSN
ncbi:MAG: 50S ribosomal protein L10 [Bdellovibrionales bacterium]|nr:50S ribosomal protein L10 [Bdellovibrionales bacterium]